ncbi:MAG TPA: hypothetical protein VFZ91_12065 [Allosphingosinicella sp.]
MAERPARRSLRILETALIAAVAAGVGWCGWGLWHDRRLAAGLAQVHLGMGREAVEAVLGRPDWVGGCGARIAAMPREGCARELGYASAFAPLLPTYYLVQLDRRGRVIEAEALGAR